MYCTPTAFIKGKPYTFYAFENTYLWTLWTFLTINANVSLKQLNSKFLIYFLSLCFLRLHIESELVILSNART